mmetsp:Transcript_38365/g.63530  ORF Transcript_38365/g.63530 Transcript_38365/m.63530 type:complete len:88 (+) Transcript_38365:785-1048(+)
MAYVTLPFLAGRLNNLMNRTMRREFALDFARLRSSVVARCLAAFALAVDAQGRPGQHLAFSAAWRDMPIRSYKERRAQLEMWPGARC